MLDRIAPDVPVNVERVTFPAMVADGSLYAVDGDTYWIDAGTPATYLPANLDLLDGRRGAAEAGVHPDAEVDGAVVGVGGRRRRARSRDGAVVSRLGGARRGRRSARARIVRDAIIGRPGRGRRGRGARRRHGRRRRRRSCRPARSWHGVRIPEES